jgi:hypothetical protein
MDKSLDEIKQQLSGKYLGRAGIHSVGISRADNVIRLYARPDDDDALDTVLQEIKAEAAPYDIEVIKSDSASIT